MVDPRRERIADHADIYCQLKPGTDVAFYNGILHEVIANDWVDREFIAERVTNYGELAKTVKQYPPERAAQICGVDADTIREVARLWGKADGRASSTGAWASRSTRREPTTRAA